MNYTLPLLAATMMAACASSATPEYDARFGDAVRQARVAQTLNPDARAGADTGMDGKAAVLATGRYHESFKTPPPVVNVINIGGSTSPGR